MIRSALYPLPGDEVISNGSKHHKRPLAERLWIKVNGPWYGDAPGPDDCWEWMGKSSFGSYIMKNGRRTRNKKKFSYGRIRDEDGKMIGAHVAAWVVTYGPVPSGVYVCHTCDNHRCCNPSHLYLGTPSQNNHDAYDRQRRLPPMATRTARPPSVLVPVAEAA